MYIAQVCRCMNATRKKCELASVELERASGDNLDVAITVLFGVCACIQHRPDFACPGP